MCSCCGMVALFHKIKVPVWNLERDVVAGNRTLVSYGMVPLYSDKFYHEIITQGRIIRKSLNT